MIGDLSLVVAATRQTGFTFIELLLYVGMVTLVLTALVPFALSVIGGSEKSSSQQDLYAQARFFSERLKGEIRNAAGINSVTTNSISLVETDSAKNPTVIDLASGTVRIKQGSGATVNLHSNKTTITGFAFTNYSSADSKSKHIGFIFTLDDTYTGPRQEYQVPPVIIESSAEVRSN